MTARARALAWQGFGEVSSFRRGSPSKFKTIIINLDSKIKILVTAAKFVENFVASPSGFWRRECSFSGMQSQTAAGSSPLLSFPTVSELSDF